MLLSCISITKSDFAEATAHTRTLDQTRCSRSGENIFSALPTTQDYFGVESGTSMTTRFVAGNEALLFYIEGKSASVGKSVRTLLERVSSGHTHCCRPFLSRERG